MHACTSVALENANFMRASRTCKLDGVRCCTIARPLAVIVIGHVESRPIVWLAPAMLYPLWLAQIA